MMRMGQYLSVSAGGGGSGVPLPNGFGARGEPAGGVLGSMAGAAPRCDSSTARWPAEVERRPSYRVRRLRGSVLPRRPGRGGFGTSGGTAPGCDRKEVTEAEGACPRSRCRRTSRCRVPAGWPPAGAPGCFGTARIQVAAGAVRSPMPSEVRRVLQAAALGGSHGRIGRRGAERGAGRRPEAVAPGVTRPVTPGVTPGVTLLGVTALTCTNTLWRAFLGGSRG